jgi:hypothetical protein
VAQLVIASRSRSARAGQQGFVLLSVLLLAALIVSLTMGHARHALTAADSTHATLRAQAAEHAADSGFAWAKQSLVTSGASSATLSLGEGDISIAMVDSGEDLHSVTVTASGTGFSQEIAGIVETYRALSGSLPSLTTEGKRLVNTAAGRIDVTGAQTFADTELSGIIYLENGATLTLRNVILTGTIVSEPACSPTAWSDSDRTSIIIDGGLLIEAGAALPGCSIVAPDAAITGTGNDRVQIHGVVIARNLTLPGLGALHAQVAVTEPLALGASIDQPGSGRAPREWPDELDTGATAIRRVAFPGVAPTDDEQDAISDFDFPASR